MPHATPPLATKDEQAFWNGVQERRLILTRCARCATIQHPPSPMCPGCGSLEWDEHEATGRGTLYSWIVSNHPTKPDDAPRIVALVQLEEGARLVSNLQDVEPAEVVNDMAVRVEFREVDGVLLPQFVPDGPAGPDRGGPH